jgi:hypothetical protein
MSRRARDCSVARPYEQAPVFEEPVQLFVTLAEVCRQCGRLHDSRRSGFQSSQHANQVWSQVGLEALNSLLQFSDEDRPTAGFDHRGQRSRLFDCEGATGARM